MTHEEQNELVKRSKEIVRERLRTWAKSSDYDSRELVKMAIDCSFEVALPQLEAQAVALPDGDEPKTWREPDFRASIANVIKEESEAGAAVGWRPCTGCHETNEGYETGHYPYSKMFGCHVGSGCSECGGLGVTWEYWSKDALKGMQRDDNSYPVQPEAKAAFVERTPLRHSIAAVMFQTGSPDQQIEALTYVHGKLPASRPAEAQATAEQPLTVQARDGIEAQRGLNDIFPGDPYPVADQLKRGLDNLRARVSRGGITSREVFDLTDPLMDILARTSGLPAAPPSTAAQPDAVAVKCEGQLCYYHGCQRLPGCTLAAARQALSSLSPTTKENEK